MEKNEYMIWLSQMKSITFEDLKKLINTYKTLDKIWNVTSSKLEENIWLTRQKYNDLLNIEYKRKIQKMLIIWKIIILKLYLMMIYNILEN